MLTEEQLKKIQEAMKDTEFAKSVSETKTEEEIVSLLKDKKGITVSVEDIKDLVETVRKIPTEELNVAGGINWGEIGSGLFEGAKALFGQGKATGDIWKTLGGKNGAAQTVGAYSTLAIALAAASALGYKVYKKYYSKSGREAAETTGGDITKQ